MLHKMPSISEDWRAVKRSHRASVLNLSSLVVNSKVAWPQFSKDLHHAVVTLVERHANSFIACPIYVVQTWLASTVLSFYRILHHVGQQILVSTNQSNPEISPPYEVHQHVLRVSNSSQNLLITNFIGRRNFHYSAIISRLQFFNYFHLYYKECPSLASTGKHISTYKCLPIVFGTSI